MIAIAINDIKVHFGFKQVLDGTSFEIEAGEKVALVGSNGAGKTTLFKIIMGLETCDSGSVFIRKGATLGYLEQASDIETADWTVMDYLKDAQKEIFALEREMRLAEERMSQTEGAGLNKVLAEYDRLQNQFAALFGYETEERFSRICSAFKIDDEELNRLCGQLSGGQKTVVKLAKVLLQQPDILLLDEPTNHIDMTTMNWLEDFIRDYKGTVILISHDRYFIDKTVSKTILLEKGHADVFKGNYTFSQQEQERLLMLEFEQYKNQQRQIEAMKAALKRFREWGALGNNERMFKRAANMEKRLQKLEMIEKPQLEKDKLPIDFQAGARSGKRVLTLRDINFAYNKEPLLRNVAMDLIYRDRLGLIGDNGSGKTTLLRILFNDLTGYSGSVLLGDSVRSGYIAQEIFFENEHETVLEAFKKEAQIHENEARRVLGRYFFYGDAVYKRLENLSGGERVIVRLAMLMQRNVNFLVLDEPTNHLDIDTRELLEEALLTYQGTLLFVSHDRYFINKIATRVAHLSGGVLKIYDGDYDYFRLNAL